MSGIVHTLYSFASCFIIAFSYRLESAAPSHIIAGTLLFYEIIVKNAYELVHIQEQVYMHTRVFNMD